MESLIDHIGILNCNGAIPPGGYINSLPGVSLKSIDSIADEEQVTYLGVWADVQATAATIFYTDFIAELNKCYQLNAYCDYEAIICANVSKITNAWKYLLGAQLMIFTLHTTRINRYTTIDRKSAEELRAYYEVQYEKSIAQSAQIVDVSSCELCCGGSISSVTWLP